MLLTRPPTNSLKEMNEVVGKSFYNTLWCFFVAAYRCASYTTMDVTVRIVWYSYLYSNGPYIPSKSGTSGSQQ